MKPSDPQSWMKRMRELFEQATDLPPVERKAFVEDACGNDQALRKRLAAMLYDWETGESLFDSICEEAIWPALESLRKDPSKLDIYVQTSAAEDAAAADTLVGKRVSHFRIMNTIGMGGMGMVYKAHDESLDRPVALKFLPPAIGMDSSARQRFIREAKTASGLDHENIATIHEIGETGDGQTFIAMAYYPGQTLKELLAKGALSSDEALDYAMQLASALKEAHKCGVIHRDVKPGNLQITHNNVLKLLDFGLAKFSSGPAYTQVGEMVGTAAYMSPEQARGESVDHRTDIWSVGVVLYEMLTGKRPFEGDSAQSVIHAILEKDPFTKFRSEETGIPISSPMKAVLRTCLQKDPRDRYQSAGELLDDLERVKRGSPPLTRPFSPVRFSRIAGKWIAAIVLLAATYYVAEKWIHNSMSPVSKKGEVTFARMLVSPFKEDAGTFWGIFWGDYDGDADMDLFVSGLEPRLFRNEGDGSFTRVTDGGLIDQLEIDEERPWGGSWVDYDNDGDLDLYLAYFDNFDPVTDRLFLNNGDGTFTREEADWISPLARVSVSWADADNDGLVDLFAAAMDGPGGTLFRNLPDGTMVPIEPSIGRSLGCDWSDYDLDGDVDLFVGGRPSLIFRNDGDWVFTEMTPEHLPGAPALWGTTYGVSTGDFDNDGDPDLVVCNDRLNQFFRNDREAGWTAIQESPIKEFTGHGCAWGDYDNDGFLDLIISGFRQLYHNEGNGTFTRVSGMPLTDVNLRSPGVAWADYDNDGDLDVVFSDGVSHGGKELIPPRPLALYRNDGGTNHWITLTLVGTQSNRSAIGAKVYLEATLKGNFMRQFREVKGASGQITQNDMRVHFGLADTETVERLTVHWPSGIVDEWTGLAADQFLTLVEGTSPMP